MCQNEFEYILLEMHDKIIHNPKLCLELQYRCKHRVAMRQVFPGHVRDFSGQICVREKC